ncbi:MAG TPA: M48 family metallopeptidase [Candidatus Cybelea sp.]|nr:M48 family metallopeptidase [Candidatus Cybelea sp.]
MLHKPSSDLRRKAMLQRRTMLGGIGALLATPALAQFKIPFGAPDPTPSRGGGLGLDKIFSGAQSIFEGMSLGEDDEIQMGTGLYPRMIARSGGPYRNSKVQSDIAKFAAPLLATSARPKLQWEIVVVDDSTVNAWALPGGKLAINRGLLRYLASEDELAAVISHEVGHAELSHALAEMKNKKFTEGLGSIGKEAIASRMRAGAGNFVTSQVLDALEGPLYDQITSGYSRDHEYEADQHILKVFKVTGYQPLKASSFFHTLLDLIPANVAGTTSLYSTHPGTIDRIEKLDAAAKKLPVPPARDLDPKFAEVKQTFPMPQYYRGPT